MQAVKCCIISAAHATLWQHCLRYSAALPTLLCSTAHATLQHCPCYSAALPMLLCSTAHATLQHCPCYSAALPMLLCNTAHATLQHCPVFLIVSLMCSGLDPAGLMYHGCPVSQRLDKSDAVYVDVVHTNGCRNYLVWTVGG